MTLKLWELAAAYQRLLDADEDGAFGTALEQLDAQIEDKAESIAKVIRSLEAETAALEAAAKELKGKADACENKAERLKDYLLREMQALGRDTIKGTLFTVALQKSPPSCTIGEPDLLPRAFFRLIPERYEPDKIGIINAWKMDIAVPGTTVTQGVHLRIR